MRKIGILSGALILTLLAGPVLADDMQEKHDKATEKTDSKTMKCEVIDVACYVAKNEKGEKHQACAAKCIGEGGELALLFDGNLYIPVDKNFHSARRLFVTKGGEMVNVNGKKVEKSGLKYIVVDGAEKKK